MSRNNDYITGNLLDYLYHQNYELIDNIDLSRQTNATITQQINFIGKLRNDNGTTMFFNHWKAVKNYSELYFRFTWFTMKHQKILILLSKAILMLTLETLMPFKLFNFKAKLLENTVADGANGILRNTTIPMTLNYLK